MLDHVTLAVSDFARSISFYDQVLQPLGIERHFTDSESGFAGYGANGALFFWIGQQEEGVTTITHVAFTAPDRAVVDKFHAAGLGAGGLDNGQPGLRPHYHADYYGAFVLDPDGHNIEAVCHKPANG